MTTRDEQRQQELQKATDYFKDYFKGTDVKVDFAETNVMRYCLEQIASGLDCRGPEQHRALSDYLFAVQQPDMKAAQLVEETNKLLAIFPYHPNGFNNPENIDRIAVIAALKEGVAAQNGMVGREAEATNSLDRILSYGAAVARDELDSTKKYFSKSTPPAGPK